MHAFAVWLMIGIALIVLEMATGTMYLLFLGISALLGSAAAWFGLSIGWQVAVFALPAAVSCIWGPRLTRRKRGAPRASLDIGQTVQFERWTSAEGRLARVSYRGSQWDAEVLDAAAAQHGELLHIVAIEGSRLKVARTPAGTAEHA